MPLLSKQNNCYQINIGKYHIKFGQDQAENKRQKEIERWLMILTFVFNVIIIVFSILLILFPGNSICQSENVFFTSLTEKHIGVLFLVISIAGIVALCFSFRSEPFVILSRAYLAALLVVTFVLFGFVILGFVVTEGAGGEEISGKAYKEYRLQSYSPTLQARISSRWNATRSCLVDRKICKRFIDPMSKNVTQFNATHLSPIESGCCKPSNDCGFIFITPTNWLKPENANMTNSDCASWSNDNKEFCYDCDACKAGMLQSVKDSWRMQGIIYISFGLFLIIVLIVGFHGLPWKEPIDKRSLESTIIAKCVPTALRCACCPCW